VACQEQPCNIKIADFGLAKLLTDDCGSLSTPCGTVGYAAPEITTADSYKSSVDLWSLGIILYTLLSGTPPFLTDDESTLADMVVRYRAIPELLLAAAALLLRRCFDAPLSHALSLSRVSLTVERLHSRMPHGATFPCKVRQHLAANVPFVG